VTSNGVGSPQSVKAVGTGNVGTTEGQLTFTAPPNFGAQAIGSTSAAKAVTISNTGGTPVTVQSIVSSNPSEFPIASSNCGTVNPGATCSINVAFKPAAAGARSGTFAVTSNGVGSPQSVNVVGTGTGVTTAGQLSFTVPPNFGNQAIGTASTAKLITIRNVGATAVTIRGVESNNSKEFSTTSTCGTVNPGASCSLSIAFKPLATGARTATFSIVSNGVGSPQAFGASGTGVAATSGNLSFPTIIAFNNQIVGTSSTARSVTIANTGSTTVSVQSIVSSASSEFPVTSNKCGTINPGSSCSIEIAFRPATTGPRTAKFTIASNGKGSPQTFNATGTGTPAAVGRLSFLKSTTFAAQKLGTASSRKMLAITNVGGAPVTIQSIAASSSEFSISNSTCGVVNPGRSCSFALVFKPTTLGARHTSVTISTGGVASPQTLNASGVGIKGESGGPRERETVDLVEYHHPEWDHYFVTSNVDEISKLDTGVTQGWWRTGQQFKAYSSGVESGTYVCRFFSTAFAPRSSHFYTSSPEECAVVSGSPDWELEGEVFNLAEPFVDGTCTAGLLPVYRLYNDGQGEAPNHRYSTNLEVVGQMIEQGWIPEGYGPAGTIMCSPQ
jgi:P pilus assembly chaperone PapD